MSEPKLIVIKHRMLPGHGFTTTATALFARVRDSARRHPAVPRFLELEIVGHNEASPEMRKFVSEGVPTTLPVMDQAAVTLCLFLTRTLILWLSGVTVRVRGRSFCCKNNRRQAENVPETIVLSIADDGHSLRAIGEDGSEHVSWSSDMPLPGKAAEKILRDDPNGYKTAILRAEAERKAKA